LSHNIGHKGIRIHNLTHKTLLNFANFVSKKIGASQIPIMKALRDTP
jgi:hypothetical protein